MQATDTVEMAARTASETRRDAGAATRAVPATARVVFLINSLEGGGAERVLVNLLGHLEPSLGGRADLVLLDDAPEAYVAPAWVTKHVLGARGSFGRSVLGLLRELARLRPSVTVSFLNRSNCANIIASRLLGRRCIVSERVHTGNHLGNSLSGRINKLLVRLTYPLAHHVVAVSEGVKRNLVEDFGVPAGKVTVIHNPIDTDAIRARGEAEPSLALPARFGCAVGRLMPNKNMGMLIEAYARASLDVPLVILGEGPERPHLEAHVERLGLAGKIILPGYVSNPYAVLRRADFFVSASNAEGFPNALVEALALGLPAVVTDCESGPFEVLFATQDQPRATRMTQADFGILVPVNDPEALAEGLRTIRDPGVQARYRARAPRRAEDFSVEHATGLYRDLIARFGA